MRHVSRRHRNRSNGQGNNHQNNQRRGGQNRMQVFDSNGPEVRIRGTAYQVVEKYQALAKDAASAGDRILAESYLQHAEHYQRIISAWDEEFGHQQRPFAQATQPQDSGWNSRTEAPVTADAGADSDLALPASILGGLPTAQADARATAEVAA